jgi:hypothetical protein
MDQELAVGNCPAGLICSNIHSNNMGDSRIHICTANGSQLLSHLPDKLILWHRTIWEHPAED